MLTLDHRKELVRRIRSYPRLREISHLVRKNAYGPTYIVGGKIYRTLTEILHKRNVGAAEADWDFLVLGDVKNIFIPDPWVQIKCPYGSKKNSVTLTCENPYSPWEKPLKIDIIGIKDVNNGAVGSLQKYFDAVPLDVQCIAVDAKDPLLVKGRGIDAVEKQAVSVNNPRGCLPGLNISWYIKTKAESLGFTYQGQEGYRQPCTCFGNDIKMLWRFGCKLPHLHC